MKPTMNVGNARRPTPLLNSTADASRGATAQRSHVTRLGWVVPRRVSLRYTAVPAAPIAVPRKIQFSLITAGQSAAWNDPSLRPRGDDSRRERAARFVLESDPRSARVARRPKECDVRD